MSSYVHTRFSECVTAYIDDRLGDLAPDDFDAAWTALGILLDLTLHRPLKQKVHDEPSADAPGEQKTPHESAVVLGREGGRKGGPARARALTPERRSEIARRAAEERWRAAHSSNVAFTPRPWKADV